METRLRCSSEYITKLKEFEGLRLKAYKPQGEKETSRYTIGYGHYGVGSSALEITESEADALLRSDLHRCEKALWLLLSKRNIVLNDNRWCALVDFIFNLGYGALLRSTLWKKIKKNQHDPSIIDEFRKWVYSGKNKLPGLVKRCEYRVSLWIKN